MSVAVSDVVPTGTVALFATPHVREPLFHVGLRVAAEAGAGLNPGATTTSMPERSEAAAASVTNAAARLGCREPRPVPRRTKELKGCITRVRSRSGWTRAAV